MKKLLLIIAFALQATLYAQEEGFLYTCDYENYLINCAIETDDGCYIISASYTNPMDDSWWEKPSKLLKLSHDGTLLNSVQLSDSFTRVVLLYEDTEHNIFHTVGIHWDVNTMRMYPFIASLDSNLNLSSIKDVANIPAVYTQDIPDAKAVINDNGKVLLTLAYSPTELHYMILNLDGDLECYKEHNYSSGMGYVGSLCVLQDSSGDFGHYDTHSSAEMTRINEQLEMEPVFSVYLVQENQWNNSDTIHSVYVNQSLYPTLLPLTDTSYLIAEETIESWWDHYHAQNFFIERNTVFLKCHNNGEITNSILVEARNDTLERPAYYQAMDLTDSGAVYLCAFQHTSYNGAGPEINRNHIILMKTDTNLNLIWERRFCLGDVCHRPLQVLATHDGGCLITGYMYNDEDKINFFLLKLNQNGTLESQKNEIITFPFALRTNPVSDILRLEFSPDVQPMAVELYDVQGRLLSAQSSDLENISVEGLTAGIYTMRVVMKDGSSYSDKVVKQ